MVIETLSEGVKQLSCSGFKDFSLRLHVNIVYYQNKSKLAIQ